MLWQVGIKKENAISKQGGTRAVEDEPADYFCLCQDKQDIQWSKSDLQAAKRYDWFIVLVIKIL